MGFLAIVVILASYNYKQRWAIGPNMRSSGQRARVHSDDLSLNPVEDYSFNFDELSEKNISSMIKRLGMDLENQYCY